MPIGPSSTGRTTTLALPAQSTPAPAERPRLGVPSMVTFAKIQQGEQAGKLVPILEVNPSINLIKDIEAPLNPYKTGYGRRIPTQYRVRVFDQKWRSVYV